MKKYSKLFYLFIFVISFCFLSNVKAINYEDYNYETELAKFPEIYQAKIKDLHNIYPNAIFVAKVPDNYDSSYKCYINKSWKTYNTKLNFNTMVELEYYDTFRSIKARSLVEDSNRSKDGYKSTDSWSYSYYTNNFNVFDGTRWYAANKDTIKYYLNSLNFLNEKTIFMFEALNYNNDNYTVEGIEAVLKGSFMHNASCPGADGKKYSEVILEAAKNNNMNAYFVAARMKVEQGSTKGPMVSGTYPGYEGYYNYFNVGASGVGEQVKISGLSYAKNKGWNTEYKAIIEGAYFVGHGYVDDGQNTLYLQRWDATGSCWANHQYMQNIQAPITESSIMYSGYQSKSDYKNGKYLFFVTVWKDQLQETALPNSGNPNNYLKNLTINGETVAEFDGKNEEYTYNTSTSTTNLNISAETVANTSSFYINDLKGTQNVGLSSDKQEVVIKVVAGNGAIKNYKIIINRSDSAPITPGQIISNSGYKTDGTYISGINIDTVASNLKDALQKQSTLSNIKIVDVNNNEKSTNLVTGDKVIITSDSTKTYDVVIYGDVNGDGKVSSLDYVKVKNYIMGSKSISGAYKQAADANKDNTINAKDYVKIKNHIMGNSKIEQ